MTPIATLSSPSALIPCLTSPMVSDWASSTISKTLLCSPAGSPTRTVPVTLAKYPPHVTPASRTTRSPSRSYAHRDARKPGQPAPESCLVSELKRDVSPTTQRQAPSSLLFRQGPQSNRRGVETRPREPPALFLFLLPPRSHRKEARIPEGQTHDREGQPHCPRDVRGRTTPRGLRARAPLPPQAPPAGEGRDDGRRPIPAAAPAGPATENPPAGAAPPQSDPGSTTSGSGSTRPR